MGEGMRRKPFFVFSHSFAFFRDFFLEKVFSSQGVDFLTDPTEVFLQNIQLIGVIIELSMCQVEHKGLQISHFFSQILEFVWNFFGLKNFTFNVLIYSFYFLLVDIKIRLYVALAIF